MSVSVYALDPWTEIRFVKKAPVSVIIWGEALKAENSMNCF